MSYVSADTPQGPTCAFIPSAGSSIRKETGLHGDLHAFQNNTKQNVQGQGKPSQTNQSCRIVLTKQDLADQSGQSSLDSEPCRETPNSSEFQTQASQVGGPRYGALERSDHRLAGSQESILCTVDARTPGVQITLLAGDLAVSTQIANALLQVAFSEKQALGWMMLAWKTFIRRRLGNLQHMVSAPQGSPMLRWLSESSQVSASSH